MFSVALCVLCALRVKKRGTRHPERGGRPDVSTGDIPEHRAGFRRWIICSSVQPQRAQRTTEGHREHLAGRYAQRGNHRTSRARRGGSGGRSAGGRHPDQASGQPRAACAPLGEQAPPRRAAILHSFGRAVLPNISSCSPLGYVWLEPHSSSQTRNRLLWVSLRHFSPGPCAG